MYLIFIIEQWKKSVMMPNRLVRNRQWPAHHRTTFASKRLHPIHGHQHEYQHGQEHKGEWPQFLQLIHQSPMHELSEGPWHWLFAFSNNVRPDVNHHWRSVRGENGPSWSNRASMESYRVAHWSLTAQYPSGISARLYFRLIPRYGPHKWWNYIHIWPIIYA